MVGKLVLGFVLLAWGADRFVLGTISIAQQRQWSPLLVGSVLMGCATTFPEILVSVIALMHGHVGISLGNALGSYITNIGLVLGVTALIKPLRINAQLFRQELPILTATLLLTILLLLDRFLGRLDGVILLLALTGLLVSIIRAFKKPNVSSVYHKLDVTQTTAMPMKKAILWLVVGLAALLFSAHWLVESASSLASWFGVSDLIIGLTVVAVGTSLPELVTSLMCVRRGEHDMALGNVIGSNVLGILGVVAIPGLFMPGAIDPSILWRDCSAMAMITMLVWLFAYNGSIDRAEINRWEGAVLLLFFLGYLWVVMTQSMGM